MWMKIIVPVLAMLMASFADEQQSVLRPAAELLTQKEWRLSSCGYDMNSNGRIDTSEEMIQDCQRDDSYLFKHDGTAILSDNIISGGNGVTEQTTTWKLINNNAAIDLNFYIAGLLRLNENELIIYQDDKVNGQPVRFLTILIH